MNKRKSSLGFALAVFAFATAAAIVAKASSAAPARPAASPACFAAEAGNFSQDLEVYRSSSETLLQKCDPNLPFSVTITGSGYQSHIVCCTPK